MEQTRIFTALQGRARPRSRSTWPRWSSCWCASASWSSSSRGSRRSTSTRCWPRPSGSIALDARVVLHGPDVAEDELPRLAIRPYPTQYVAPWTMKDGTDGHDPPDPPRRRAADGRRSTRRSRSAASTCATSSTLKLEPAHRARAADAHLLHRLRPRDGAGRRGTDAAGERQILAVGRLTKVHAAPHGRVRHPRRRPLQRRGLGAELLRRLVQIGRDEGLERIWPTCCPATSGCGGRRNPWASRSSRSRAPRRSGRSSASEVRTMLPPGIPAACCHRSPRILTPGRREHDPRDARGGEPGAPHGELTDPARMTAATPRRGGL